MCRCGLGAEIEKVKFLYVLARQKKIWDHERLTVIGYALHEEYVWARDVLNMVVFLCA